MNAGGRSSAKPKSVTAMSCSPDEERMLLQDRIKRLRRTLGMMVG